MGFLTTRKLDPKLDTFPHLTGQERENKIAKMCIFYFKMIKLCCKDLLINSFQWQEIVEIDPVHTCARSKMPQHNIVNNV